MATDLLSEIRSEIAARLEELRPALAEYEQLLHAASALGLDSAPSTEAVQPARPRKAATPRKPATRRAPARATTATARKPRAARKQPSVQGIVREAILGVLEHGSHTVGELVVVTAMSTASLNQDLRKLAAEGVVVKTEREGKTAWSLVGAA
ncbi:MAG TPA: hypothetical protein VHS55_00405 [Solirubrobacteraceae bacterium]|jgi:Fic family protein|nr:hypothetical protein [Solirubrobacteraceae bacterium]